MRLSVRLNSITPTYFLTDGGCMWRSDTDTNGNYTGEYWAQKAHARGAIDNRGKQFRRDGFGLAEERYAEYKAILEEVEKILAEAGLDEKEMREVGRDAGAGPSEGQSRNRR
ncbi:hypothetical protein EDD15DRAFT_2226418 [Pisolithus albus]|nr:hypothetical protein EDD15DRAFT_2226418 [Pisolithus albus]